MLRVDGVRGREGRWGRSGRGGRAAAGRVGLLALTLASVAVLATGCTGSSGGGQDDRAVAPDGGRGASTTPAPDPHAADPDPRHLRVGDCFTTGPATLPGGVLNAGSTVHIVPCGQPHDAEAFGRITEVARPYPGPSEVRDDAVRYCGNLVAAYAMDSWAFSAAANPTREFLPGQAAWDSGDRGGICFFVPHGGPVTASLRRDRHTLTADQYAYLDASDRVESAISVDPYTTDPAVNHDARYDDLSTWAGGVAESLVIEQQLLKSHQWPARAQGPVNALLQVLAAEAPLWQDASDATTLAGVKAQVAVARRGDGTAQQKAVRQALGLAAVRAAGAGQAPRTGTAGG